LRNPQVGQRKNLVQQLQKAVTQWDGLLWASGGTLVPEKCFWYLV